MKTSHAASPCSPPAQCIQPAATARGAYHEFVSAEKAKCQVMLDILEFLLRFESIGRIDAGNRKQGLLIAKIDEARHKLKS